MKHFSWDVRKNLRLQKERGISFEEIVFHIELGDILDLLEHPDSNKYKGQLILVVQVGNYAYLVPFEESDDEIVLRTIIPSRKATRKYLKRDQIDD